MVTLRVGQLRAGSCPEALEASTAVAASVRRTFNCIMASGVRWRSHHTGIRLVGKVRGYAQQASRILALLAPGRGLKVLASLKPPRTKPRDDGAICGRFACFRRR